MRATRPPRSVVMVTVVARLLSRISAAAADLYCLLYHREKQRSRDLLLYHPPRKAGPPSVGHSLSDIYYRLFHQKFPFRKFVDRFLSAIFSRPFPPVHFVNMMRAHIYPHTHRNHSGGSWRRLRQSFNHFSSPGGLRDGSAVFHNLVSSGKGGNL